MENSYKESKISKELKHGDGSVSNKNEEHQSNLETWRKPRNQKWENAYKEEADSHTHKDTTCI